MDGPVSSPPNPARDRAQDRAVIEEHAGERRIALILDSFQRLIGRPLIVGDGLGAGADMATLLWESPAVVLAHDTRDDPQFFYSNLAGLDRFALDARQLIAMPSRLSAEEPRREERGRLLQRVRDEGFITDYSGVRIASTGQRFRIARSIVWNLTDETGAVHGQAATFSDWIDL